MERQLFKKPKKLRFLFKSLIGGGVLILILIIFWFLGQIYLLPQGEEEKKIILTIEKGTGLAEISSQLKKEGLIRSEFLFQLAAFAKGARKKLQAGTYYLSPVMTISEIIDKLKKGDILKKTITIPEGWRLNDIALYLEMEKLGPVEEFFKIVKKNFSQEFDFLKEKPKNRDLEGYLFPDSYQIYPNESLERIIKKMLKNFGKKITPDLREEIKKQGRTLDEVLIMASLLEKELKTFEEKQIGAGILWKRLKAGWLLQVDATLTYLTGKTTQELTREDLNLDSPYNTYKYFGLPPGPICNPGLASIKAAIFYKETPYWFYLTTPKGKTIFSKTLWEHNRARAIYFK